MNAVEARLPIATAAVLAVAFAFGILTLWAPSAWPFAVFEAAVLAMTSAWLIAGAIRPAAIDWSPWLALPLGVVAIGVAQLLIRRSENAWETRRVAMEWFTHSAVAFLAYQACRNVRLRHWLLRAFTLSAGALALAAIVQHFTAPQRILWLFDSGYPDLVFGPFVYHTKLANFAELAIPCAVWLAVKDRRRSALYLASAAVAAGSVVAAASRGGILVIAIELAVLGWFSRRERLRLGRAAVGFAGALAITIAVVGWDLAAERLSLDAAEDMRWPVLLSSLAMCRRFWPFGCGLGTWSTVYPEFARFDVHLFINQAHCDWLQWAAEGGIALPLLAAAMLVAVFRAARREWWVIGLAVVWLHGLFDYPMQQTPVLASLQIAFFGASAAIMRDAAGRRRRAPRPSGSAAAPAGGRVPPDESPVTGYADTNGTPVPSRR